jgi:hypothetical protein
MLLSQDESGIIISASSRRLTLKSGLAAENRTQMLLIGESNAEEQY